MKILFALIAILILSSAGFMMANSTETTKEKRNEHARRTV